MSDRNQPLSSLQHWLRQRRHTSAWGLSLLLAGSWLALGVIFNPAPGQALLQRGLVAWLIDWGNPATYLRGLWPVGDPFLLRLTAELTGNGMLAARLIAFLGGFFLLLGCYHLVLHLTGRKGLALSTLPFIALTPVMARGLLFAEPGFIYAALVLGALNLAIRPQSGSTRMFAAGILAGLAYLFRYQALILPLFGLLAALRLNREHWLREWGVFLGGFLCGALPQLVAATLAFGDPLHQLSFSVLGWELLDGAVPAEKLSLWWLASQHPLELLGAWAGSLGRSAWTTLWPLGVLGWWALWRARGRLDVLDERRLTLFAVAGGVLLLADGLSPAISGMVPVVAAALTAVAAVTAAGVWQRPVVGKVRVLWVPLIVLLLLVCRMTAPELISEAEDRVDARLRAEEVFRLLAKEGITRPEEVACGDWLLYNPGDDRLVPTLVPAKQLVLDPSLTYARPWAPTDDQLLPRFAQASGARAIVLRQYLLASPLKSGTRLLGRVDNLKLYLILHRAAPPEIIPPLD